MNEELKMKKPKTKTSISVDTDLFAWAKKEKLVLSRCLELKLKELKNVIKT